MAYRCKKEINISGDFSDYIIGVWENENLDIGDEFRISIECEDVLEDITFHSIQETKKIIKGLEEVVNFIKENYRGFE